MSKFDPNQGGASRRVTWARMEAKVNSYNVFRQLAKIVYDLPKWKIALVAACVVLDLVFAVVSKSLFPLAILLFTSAVVVFRLSVKH
jgi:hypothetical protein